MITNLVMFLLHIMYRRLHKRNKTNVILFIRGTGKDYPHYMLYTENENVYRRMEEF